jgi:hypothetical protein
MHFRRFYDRDRFATPTAAGLDDSSGVGGADAVDVMTGWGGSSGFPA